MTYRNPKLLKAVRDLPCASCGTEDGSVIAAHRNEGKGMGIKTADLPAALCFRCHAALDQGKDMTRDERRKAWDNAFFATMVALFERGKVVVK